MFRTKLVNRTLPGYTRGEEIFNMVTHIVGAALGIAAFLACIIIAAYNRNIWGIVSGAVYGFTVILLFTMSSIYHGLTLDIPKKVFQVLDHCTIFLLIAGTYTPILLNQFRVAFPIEAWTMFGIVWGLAVLGITLNSIDLKKFKVFSLICYLGMGWLIIGSFGKLKVLLGAAFCKLLLAGGILYTLGAVIYVAGKKMKIKYMHSVFHIFVDAAAFLHFLGIAAYIMPL